jgi:hypothetical protein
VSEAQRYRFFVHREQSVYRLVLRDDGGFPGGTHESEWQLTRVRDAGDVNADVRSEIAARGYCLFAIGLTLDAIRRTTPE